MRIRRLAVGKSAVYFRENRSKVFLWWKNLDAVREEDLKEGFQSFDQYGNPLPPVSRDERGFYLRFDAR